MSTSGYHSSSPSSALFQRPGTDLREMASQPVPCDTELIGTSAAMERLRLQVRRIGPHFRTVLVSGEAGSGKEITARTLHGLSQGADQPFVVCPAATLEGSNPFTALMKAAGRGTLFLDDIGEMPLEAQGHLLRVLRRQEWSQEGLPSAQRLSVRLIASSSRDLRGLVSAGRFRQELYRRIATLEITVPPLRERMEDLPMLAESFVSQFAQMYGKRVERIAQDAMERLMAHRWLGNVRELENILRNGVLLSDGVELLAEELPEFVAVEGNADAGGIVRLQDVIERHVLHVLKSCEGNKLRAAETLGISRSTLYRMLESCTLSSR